MKITQYKEGSKAVKVLDLNDLVEIMRSREACRAVEMFREKLDGYPLGYPCPDAVKVLNTIPCMRRRRGSICGTVM